MTAFDNMTDDAFAAEADEALDRALERAAAFARARRHAQTQLEHLLLSLLNDIETARLLRACGADVGSLRRQIQEYLDAEYEGPMGEHTEPSAEFKSVAQRAALDAHEAGRAVVHTRDVLRFIFDEPSTPVAKFLLRQNITEGDVLEKIAEESKKVETKSEIDTSEDDEGGVEKENDAPKRRRPPPFDVKELSSEEDPDNPSSNARRRRRRRPKNKPEFQQKSIGEITATCCKCNTGNVRVKKVTEAQIRSLIKLEDIAPLAGPLQQMLQGEWEDLSPPQIVTLLLNITEHVAGLGQLLSFDFTEILGLRRRKAHYYPESDLVELWLRIGEDPPSVFLLLSHPKTAIALNGVSAPIHSFNKMIGGIDVKDQDNALGYLEFFCCCVHGDEGPFAVFSSVEGLKKLAEFNEANIDFDVHEPIVHDLSDEKNEPSRIIDTMTLYGDHLFKVQFEVNQSGMIDMREDEPLAFEVSRRIFPVQKVLCERCLERMQKVQIEEHPKLINNSTAVRIAYGAEIQNIASMIRADLSVLVHCDKSMVQTIWREILKSTDKDYVLAEGEYSSSLRSMLDVDLAELRTIVASDQQDDKVIIIPNLDVMATGGYNGFVSDPAREIVSLLSKLDGNPVLGFSEPLVDLPELLVRRFSTQQSLQGVPAMVLCKNGTAIPFGKAIITKAESEKINEFDAARFHKNVAGLNAIQVRQAISYTMNVHKNGEEITMRRIEEATQKFKSSAIATFEIPDTKFEDIGGYKDVKKVLRRAVKIVEEFGDIAKDDRANDILPKGFIMHGPPGTGKTLLAKAVANELNANIVVVSGPEIVGMYVGESERKIREIFSDARVAAPSVVVFDEFDAIAGRRTDDPGGGARANNAMVAQLLTEMDGFRPDMKILVIGTTNRIDRIDEALLRPSRLQSLHVDLPDDDARRQIISIHSKRFGFDLENTLADQIVRSTKNFNGDEIQSLFRDAVVARKFDEPLLAEDGELASDAFLFGRLVQVIRRRIETERYAVGVRSRPNNAQQQGTSQRADPGHVIAIEGAWDESGMLDITPSEDEASVWP